MLKVHSYHWKNSPDVLSEIFHEISKIVSIEMIIESGTAMGDGSTVAWARTGLPVWTIESNPQRWLIAKRSLQLFKNVVCFLGFSLSYKEMLAFIEQDHEIYKNENILFNRTSPEKNREKYLREIRQAYKKMKELCFPVEEKLLCRFLDQNIKQKKLIFLDSCGGTGWLEFEAVKNHPSFHQDVLVLDDCQHIKHWRSMEYIKKHYEASCWQEIDKRILVFSKLFEDNPLSKIS